MLTMCWRYRMYSQNVMANWSRWWYRLVRLSHFYACLRGIWSVWVRLFHMWWLFQCRVRFGWRPQVCCSLRLLEGCSRLRILVSSTWLIFSLTSCDIDMRVLLYEISFPDNKADCSYWRMQLMQMWLRQRSGEYYSKSRNIATEIMFIWKKSLMHSHNISDGPVAWLFHSTW